MIVVAVVTDSDFHRETYRRRPLPAWRRHPWRASGDLRLEPWVTKAWEDVQLEPFAFLFFFIQIPK